MSYKIERLSRSWKISGKFWHALNFLTFIRNLRSYRSKKEGKNAGSM